MERHCHLSGYRVGSFGVLFLVIQFVGGTPPFYFHTVPGYSPPFDIPSYGYIGTGRGMPYVHTPAMSYIPTFGPVPSRPYHEYPHPYGGGSYSYTVYPRYPTFTFEYGLTPDESHMISKMHSDYKRSMSRYYGPSRSYDSAYDISGYQTSSDTTRSMSGRMDYSEDDYDRDSYNHQDLGQGDFDFPRPSEADAQRDTIEYRDIPSRNRVPYRIHRSDEQRSDNLPVDNNRETDFEIFEQPLPNNDRSDVPLPERFDRSSPDVQRTNIPLSDVQRSDIPLSDIDRSDIHLSDVQRSDIPYSDIERSDIHLSDVQRSDIPLSDVQRSDIALSDIERYDRPVPETSEARVDDLYNDQHGPHSERTSGVNNIPTRSSDILIPPLPGDSIDVGADTPAGSSGNKKAEEKNSSPPGNLIQSILRLGMNPSSNSHTGDNIITARGQGSDVASNELNEAFP